jgi:hypothetical protein
MGTNAQMGILANVIVGVVARCSATPRRAPWGSRPGAWPGGSSRSSAPGAHRDLRALGFFRPTARVRGSTNRHGLPHRGLQPARQLEDEQSAPDRAADRRALLVGGAFPGKAWRGPTVRCGLVFASTACCPPNSTPTAALDHMSRGVASNERVWKATVIGRPSICAVWCREPGRRNVRNRTRGRRTF